MKDCDFMKMIDICSKQQDVKEEVYKNHDENMWWPMSIKDGKKRLLIAGLSTRISYNMILTYNDLYLKKTFPMTYYLPYNYFLICSNILFLSVF